MIEGLRLLPFTADLPIFDCSTCQNGNPAMNLTPQSTAVRRLQACGFLPRDPKVTRVFGVPAGVDFEVTACPGYTTSLPEVRETVRYRPSWLKGYMPQHAGADIPEAAYDAQNVLDGAVVTKQNWDTTERARKAEADGKR